MPSKQGKQRKSGLRGRGARLGIIAVLAAGVVFALSACGGGASSESSSSGTLKAALSSEPAPLDPDTYYEAIGLPLMTAMYEGLVTYAPNSPKIEPQLATSWNISPDGKTYEFTLRKGVQFSDGSSFDAAAAKASFQRRIDLEGGPSYMLEAVKSMETKGSDTFIVHLEHPVAPFMDYLASPYGPVMTSPKAVSEHEVKEDHAAAWIGSHSAGTGPYMIENIKKGSSYTLTENPHYWGDAPHFKTVTLCDNSQPLLAATGAGIGRIGPDLQRSLLPRPALAELQGKRSGAGLPGAVQDGGLGQSRLLGVRSAPRCDRHYGPTSTTPRSPKKSTGVNSQRPRPRSTRT